MYSDTLSKTRRRFAFKIAGDIMSGCQHCEPGETFEKQVYTSNEVIQAVHNLCESFALLESTTVVTNDDRGARTWKLKITVKV